MERGLVCMVLLALLVGCGGGGGTAKNPQGGEDEPAWEWIGDYSFRAEAISYTCDSEPPTGFAITLKLFQFENQLLAEYVEGSDSDPDTITIIESDPLTGGLDTDGSFSMTQTQVYTIDGYAGQFIGNHTLQGLLSASGWTGHYEYITSHSDSQTICIYTAEFTGERLVFAPSAASHAEPAAPSEATDHTGKFLGRVN